MTKDRVKNDLYHSVSQGHATKRERTKLISNHASVPAVDHLTFSTGANGASVACPV